MPGTGKFWIRTSTIDQSTSRQTNGSMTKVLLLFDGQGSIVIWTSKYILYIVRRTSASRLIFLHTGTYITKEAIASIIWVMLSH